MKIGLLCNDTRGGVQPYVALALGLKAAGHDVRAVAPSNLAALFSERGLSVRELSGDVEAALRASGGAAERGAIASMRFASRELPKILATWKREASEACADVDIVTGGIGGMVIGLDAAAKLRKPFVETHLQPVNAPSNQYPALLIPWLPRPLRTVGQRVSETVLWMSMQMKRPSAGQTHPVSLYGFSPRVVGVKSDPNKERIATGYWTLSSEGQWHPPEPLQRFLGQPGPVVSVGFGSMANRAPAEVAKMVIAAARAAKTRVVLLSGWGGMTTEDSQGDVYLADSIPHDWLFKRVQASVHHCGAGTTGAALTAGIPSVCVPFTMDQPFWATRLHELGVAAATIPRKHLSQTSLSAALTRALSDQTLQQRAAQVGAEIQRERGIETAVTVFSGIEATLR